MLVQQLLVHRVQLNFNLNLNTEVTNKSYIMLLAGQLAGFVLYNLFCLGTHRLMELSK